MAQSVIINNPTNQWYQEPNTAWLVQPYRQGIIVPLGGTQVASLLNQSPPNITQPPSKSGENILAIFDSAELAPNPGVDLLLGTASVQPIGQQVAIAAANTWTLALGAIAGLGLANLIGLSVGIFAVQPAGTVGALVQVARGTPAAPNPQATDILWTGFLGGPATSGDSPAQSPWIMTGDPQRGIDLLSGGKSDIYLQSSNVCTALLTCWFY